MENDKKVIPICRKCNFQYHDYCYHPDSDVTDFINGSKECIKLNYEGQCKLYEVIKPKEVPKTTVGTVTVDLTLNTEPFKKKMAELLAGL
jgi:hypothetical protein